MREIHPKVYQSVEDAAQLGAEAIKKCLAARIPAGPLLANAKIGASTIHSYAKLVVAETQRESMRLKHGGGI